MDLKDLVIARQIIIDNYSEPENNNLTNDKNALSINQSSESCIDNITVELLIDKNKIKSARFEGEGCAISISSTNIMAKTIEGKTILQSQKIINEYMKMIENKKIDEEILNQLIVFSNVYKQSNRIRCALIGVSGYQQIIDQVKK